MGLWTRKTGRLLEIPRLPGVPPAGQGLGGFGIFERFGRWSRCGRCSRFGLGRCSRSSRCVGGLNYNGQTLRDMDLDRWVISLVNSFEIPLIVPTRLTP